MHSSGETNRIFLDGRFLYVSLDSCPDQHRFNVAAAVSQSDPDLDGNDSVSRVFVSLRGAVPASLYGVWSVSSTCRLQDDMRHSDFASDSVGSVQPFVAVLRKSSDPVRSVGPSLQGFAAIVDLSTDAAIPWRSYVY